MPDTSAKNPPLVGNRHGKTAPAGFAAVFHFARLAGLVLDRKRPAPVEADFVETPRAPRPAPPVQFPRLARRWKVTFEVVDLATRAPRRFAIVLEALNPFDRKAAEQAARRSVERTIARFVEFHPLAP